MLFNQPDPGAVRNIGAFIRFRFNKNCYRAEGSIQPTMHEVKEIELMLCGADGIDVDDWEKHTE